MGPLNYDGVNADAYSNDGACTLHHIILQNLLYDYFYNFQNFIKVLTEFLIKERIRFPEFDKARMIWSVIRSKKNKSMTCDQKKVADLAYWDRTPIITRSAE